MAMISANRSPVAFARNPEADRAFFPDGIDPQTTLLRVDRDGTPVAAINWFATHGTSMTNHNQLISGDNKGYASYLFEKSNTESPGRRAGWSSACGSSASSSG